MPDVASFQVLHVTVDGVENLALIHPHTSEKLLVTLTCGRQSTSTKAFPLQPPTNGFINAPCGETLTLAADDINVGTKLIIACQLGDTVVGKFTLQFEEELITPQAITTEAPLYSYDDSVGEWVRADASVILTFRFADLASNGMDAPSYAPMQGSGQHPVQPTLSAAVDKAPATSAGVSVEVVAKAPPAAGPASATPVFYYRGSVPTSGGPGGTAPHDGTVSCRCVHCARSRAKAPLGTTDMPPAYTQAFAEHEAFAHQVQLEARRQAEAHRHAEAALRADAQRAGYDPHPSAAYGGMALAGGGALTLGPPMVGHYAAAGGTYAPTYAGGPHGGYAGGPPMAPPGYGAPPHPHGAYGMPMGGAHPGAHSHPSAYPHGFPQAAGVGGYGAAAHGPYGAPPPEVLAQQRFAAASQQLEAEAAALTVSHRRRLAQLVAAGASDEEVGRYEAEMQRVEATQRAAFVEALSAQRAVMGGGAAAAGGTGMRVVGGHYAFDGPPDVAGLLRATRAGGGGGAGGTGAGAGGRAGGGGGYGHGGDLVGDSGPLLALLPSADPNVPSGTAAAARSGSGPLSPLRTQGRRPSDPSSTRLLNASMDPRTRAEVAAVADRIMWDGLEPPKFDTLRDLRGAQPFLSQHTGPAVNGLPHRIELTQGVTGGHTALAAALPSFENTSPTRAARVTVVPSDEAATARNLASSGQNVLSPAQMFDPATAAKVDGKLRELREREDALRARAARLSAATGARRPPPPGAPVARAPDVTEIMALRSEQAELATALASATVPGGAYELAASELRLPSLYQPPPSLPAAVAAGNAAAAQLAAQDSLQQERSALLRQLQVVRARRDLQKLRGTVGPRP